MTHTERLDVLETVIKAAAGRVPVIAGVNAATTREVAFHCETAEKYGAAAVMVAPPYYSLPSADELFEHFSTIDQRVGIPIMLYNFPARTGVDLRPEFVERLAELKNVRYIKDSTGETWRISEIIRRCGDRMKVFCGGDTVAFEALMLGSAGWVAAIANVCAVGARRRSTACWKARTMRRLATISTACCRCSRCSSTAGSSRNSSRRAAGIAGRDAGPPRRPLLPPNAEETGRDPRGP